MKNKAYLQYTYKHRKIVMYLANKYFSNNKELLEQVKFHDLDKLFMYLFYEKEDAHNTHRKLISHHQNEIEKTKLDYIEMVLDWESARYTKFDKPLNAYDTLYRFYPELEEHILPILKDLGLDKSGIEFDNDVLEYSKTIDDANISDIKLEIIEYLDIIMGIRMKLDELICINDNVDIDEYIEFIDDVRYHMAHPEWLGLFTKKEIEELINDGCKLFIYKNEDEIVCSFMYFEGNDKAIKKFKLNCLKEEFCLCGPIVVNPKYVGNSLQRQMLEELKQYAISNNKKYIVTKVTDGNKISINNFIKSGYKFKLSYENKELQTKNVYILNI